MLTRTKPARIGHAGFGALWLALLCLCPAPGFSGEMPDPNQPEQARTILAGQVRQQGHLCDKAVAARHDPALSRPDEPAWILVCSNATYRVRLRADMAAKVEPISGAP